MALRYVRVANIDDLPPGNIKGVRPWPGYRMALCNVDGDIYAVDDTCTHAGGIMHFGDLHGDQLECPVHLAIFSVKTGEVVAGPGYGPIRTYPVRIDGNHIEVGIEE